jgi:hypothetical protein
MRAAVTRGVMRCIAGFRMGTAGSRKTEMIE